VKAVPGSTSPAESGTAPIDTFVRAHPGAVKAIAIGTGIGACLGLGVGLGLPGRGASYQAAVTVLIVLGFALVGALIAAGVAIAAPSQAAHTKKPDWQKRMDAKMKEGTSSSVPRRVKDPGTRSSG
jgi:hypothetical protein